MFKPPQPLGSAFRRITAIGTALAVISIGPSVGLGIGSAAAAESNVSQAGPSADEAKLERARRLYKDGRVAYDRGRYDEAAEKFKLAYDLAGDPNLLFNLALVYDRLGDLERSLEYMRRYRNVAPDEEHQALDSRIAGLEARISDRASDPKDPPPVDPKDPPDDPLDPVPTDPPVDDPPDDEPDFKVFNGLAIGLTVTAGLLLAAGAGLGGASLARTRAANEGCEDIEGGTYCMTDVEGDVDASRNLAIGSDVTLGIGAAVGIAAIVVIALRAKKKKQLRSSAYVIPSGLGLAGRF